MEFVSLKVKRQDDADGLSYWERLEVPYEDGMTVAQALHKLGISREEKLEDVGDENGAPPCCETSCLEGNCGACAMLINGRLRLACTALVDEFSGQIVLEPLPKFPVVRDLVVDRSSMSGALADLRAFACIENVADDTNVDIRMKPALADKLSAFDGCVMCGVCSNACPQVSERTSFRGAFVLARLAQLELHPWTAGNSDERITAAAQKGGVADCSGAMSCENACPAGLALASASALLGRIVGSQTLASYFQKV